MTPETNTDKTIVLASGSAYRLSMLRAAGVLVEGLAPGLDEDALKDGLRAEGVSARDLADTLAEAKAMKVARRVPSTLILGADQVLVLADGTQLDKPQTPEEACEHLRRMSGQTHRLLSAAVFAEDARPVWRHVDTAKMTMRVLSDAFIAEYVAAHWDDIRQCVGCYQIEGAGAQLFARVEGNHFTIIGLPLFAVLDYLRIRGHMPS
jgi:septum formation protein